MKYVGMTQITDEQAKLMVENYTESKKDQVLDTVNELENKLDDLSSQCCLASYEVEDTLHDLQLCIDKIKDYVK